MSRYKYHLNKDHYPGAYALPAKKLYGSLGMMRIAAMTCGRGPLPYPAFNFLKKQGQMKLARNAEESPAALLATRISDPERYGLVCQVVPSPYSSLITKGPSGEARCWVSFRLRSSITAIRTIRSRDEFIGAPSFS